MTCTVTSGTLNLAHSFTLSFLFLLLSPSFLSFCYFLSFPYFYIRIQPRCLEISVSFPSPVKCKCVIAQLQQKVRMQFHPQNVRKISRQTIVLKDIWGWNCALFVACAMMRFYFYRSVCVEIKWQLARCGNWLVLQLQQKYGSIRNLCTGLSLPLPHGVCGSATPTIDMAQRGAASTSIQHNISTYCTFLNLIVSTCIFVSFACVALCRVLLPKFVHYIVYYGLYTPGTVLHISGLYNLLL